jgi:hypothetical protein
MALFIRGLRSEFASVLFVNRKRKTKGARWTELNMTEGIDMLPNFKVP